ncbi:MAG: hypothetical protein ACREGR_04970 [Minisyncoccia bacterium]
MMKVRLVEVQGDQEEFADLIGCNGRLTDLRADGRTFMPDGRGDFLTMVNKRTTRKGDRVKVATKLGNVFVFRVLEGGK